eukprot:5577077-Pyramimonas_sp.AAC.2
MCHAWCVPHADEVGTIGCVPKGDWKWHGGVLAADGNIYGFPAHAEAVLKISPATGEVTQIGGPFKGRYKWLGGAVGDDGNIYCMPSDANSVLRICPGTGECSVFGEVSAMKNKWQGAVKVRAGPVRPHDCECFSHTSRVALHQHDHNTYYSRCRPLPHSCTRTTTVFVITSIDT